MMDNDEIDVWWREINEACPGIHLKLLYKETLTEEESFFNEWQLDLTINFTPPVYWIYPGERRPVVVKADTELEAIRKVRENPNYDGFGAKIYRVEEFAEICQLA